MFFSKNSTGNYDLDLNPTNQKREHIQAIVIPNITVTLCQIQ